MKHIIITVALVILTMLLVKPPTAQAEMKTPSATFIDFGSINQAAKLKEKRIKILKAYLEDHNSPMTESASTFVETAEENNLDWRFVASISGVESYFGKHIPYNSYNGWGWGVYGNNVLRFTSWNEAITVISQTLKSRYVDRGATDIYSIGRIYASDPNWANKVQHFMNDLAVYEKNFTDTKLSISI